MIFLNNNGALSMIEIRNLTRKFGDFRAVDGLSFSVQAGEVLGFLGPNGAGKSTTMKMLTGFLTPTEGDISICGHDIERNALAAKQLIGYLPEGAPSYGEMTVLQFLDFMADMRSLSGDHKAQRIAAVVNQVELQEVLDKTIDTLSKGFKRRVGLAQAILHDPKVLILDEPTDGLDPNQKHQVRELIRGMARDKIIIVSTHILEEVTAVCTRAIVIARGKLLADGTPSDLLARSPLHNAVRVSCQHDDNLRNKLAQLNGVAAVDVVNDSEMIVRAQHTKSIFTLVHDCLRASGRNIDSISVEMGTLDEVFRSITLEA